MLMPIRLISVLFLCSLLMGKECKDETYIQYHTSNFNLTFKHVGFMSPQIHECVIPKETVMYNNDVPKRESFIIKDNVKGIEEIDGDFLVIHTYAGANNNFLYFIHKQYLTNIYDDNGIRKYTLVPVPIDNRKNPIFQGNYEVSTCKEKIGKYLPDSIIVKELNVFRNKYIIKKYILVKDKSGYHFKVLEGEKKYIMKDKNGYYLKSIK